MTREKSSGKVAKGDKDKDRESAVGAGSRPASPEPLVPLYDKDLIRMLSEVNFIQGEVRPVNSLRVFSLKGTKRQQSGQMSKNIQN